MSAFAECPFAECQWSTADPAGEVEADALVGGWDRLALHLRVMHGATPEPDEEAWTDEGWTASLFPRSFEWEATR